MFLGRRWHLEWPARTVLTLTCLGSAACGRPAVASVLPLLELGFSAQRLRTDRLGGELDGADQRWRTMAFVALRFEPRIAAADIPLRAELSPETWVLPCDSDDVICLQEALEAEAELASSMGQLQ